MARLPRLLRASLLLLACSCPAIRAEPLLVGAEQAVRDTLLAQATASGLSDPILTIHITEPHRASPACPTPLDYHLSGRHLSRLRLIARCAPLAAATSMNVRAEMRATVVVMVRPIASHQLIDPSAVSVRQMPLTTLHRTFASLDAALGQASRRRLRVGSVLFTDDLEAPEVVQRGQAVHLVSDASGVAVSAAGTALAGGTLGEVIDVRNDSSGRTLRARVTGPSEVQVVTAPMPL